MNLYHDLPIFDDENNLNVVIEVSKGMLTKYEFDKKLNAIKLDRILTTPIAFPYNYGFIPQTWNEDDKDPLDAIVISSQDLLPGVVVSCRVLGYMQVLDRGEKDDKVVCVPVGDSVVAHLQTVSDLSDQLKERFEYFMTHYKDLEQKKVEFKQWRSVKDASALIERCRKSYLKK
jgi:inorganic pyrophosphatase